MTLEEVQRRIKDYEKEYAMTFDEFEELLLQRKITHRFMGVYSEWGGLVHAYRGYIEGGELDYVIEDMRDLKPKEAAMLTPKRLELLYSLANLRVESINDLA
jgi:hypothetical protein